MKQANQITRPRINKIGPTQKEPKKVRVYFKSGDSTMLLTKNIPHEAALLLEVKLNKFLAKYDCKLLGTLIQTQ